MARGVRQGGRDTGQANGPETGPDTGPDSSQDDGRNEGQTAGRHEKQKDIWRRLSAAEVWRLIGATYLSSLPYLLIFLAALLLATWLFTELVF